jgi:hypothetical protein
MYHDLSVREHPATPLGEHLARVLQLVEKFEKDISLQSKTQKRENLIMPYN